MKKNIMEKLLLVLITALSIMLFVGFSNAQSVSINTPANADTALSVHNNGTGHIGSFITNNTNNTGSLIYGDHYGKGGGIRMRLMNSQNINPGIYMYQYGNGDGLYVGSNKSKVARFYANGGNTDTALTITHD